MLTRIADQDACDYQALALQPWLLQESRLSELNSKSREFTRYTLKHLNLYEVDLHRFCRSLLTRLLSCFSQLIHTHTNYSTVIRPDSYHLHSY